MNLINHLIVLLFFTLSTLVGFSADTEGVKGFKEDLKKAESGDAVAQCEVAKHYAAGNISLGINADRKIAESWYLKAASLGYTPVYGKLSSFYLLGAKKSQDKGLSESEDLAEHIKWSLLNANMKEYPRDNWAYGKISESTKLEGERRAKAFRAEQAKKTPAPAGK